MEFAKHIVLNSKKQLEADMGDLQKQLEEVTRSKQEVFMTVYFTTDEYAFFLPMKQISSFWQLRQQRCYSSPGTLQLNL